MPGAFISLSERNACCYDRLISHTCTVPIENLWDGLGLNQYLNGKWYNDMSHIILAGIRNAA